ncbi:MAG: FAD-binding protein [Streptosporangiales bacterium]|nr:FAD-binding protein [Streptosporangiales bacterium]
MTIEDPITTITDTVLSPRGFTAELQRRVTGRVVSPSDPDWDEQRLGWNLMVDQQPAAVVHVESCADVVAAVRFANENGLSVAAQPVGHGATRALDGAIILRLGALQDLDIDIAAGTATVSAGVRWRDLNAALSGTGLSGLPGSSGDPTVVGFTLGGGVSWFGRKFGMAANVVRSFELVTAEGEQITVTRDSYPDLFWALRGGGGNFGIVTSMEIELVFTGRIYGGRLMWSIDHARELLRAYAEVTASAPAELSVWAWVMNVPDVPFVPEPIRGKWMMAIDVTFLGSPTDAEDLLAPLHEVAAPALGELGTVPLADVGLIAAEPEDPTPGLIAAELLTGFDHEIIDALLDVIAIGEPGELAMFGIRHLGGAFARSSARDGACGHIAEPYMLVFGDIIFAPELAAPAQARIDGVRRALAPYTGERVPSNFRDDEHAELIHPADVLDRLRAIKRQVDPRGVIRGNKVLGDALPVVGQTQ